MPKRRTDISLEEITKLHSQGLYNIEIAKKLKIDANTLRRRLKELGLSSNKPRGKPLIINGNFGICSKCGKSKPINHFEYNTRTDGRKNIRRISYCKDCRNKQRLKSRKSSFISFLNSRANTLRSRGIMEGYEADIFGDYLLFLWEKQQTKCFYSDVEMRWDVSKKADSLAVDKIIPSLGYIKGNVVLTCSRANQIKFNLTLDELRRWIPFWYNRIIRHFNESGVIYDGEYLIFPNGAKHFHRKLEGH